MEPSILVSVIISNYNYGRFITEAIESVLNQTYSNVELIVVDDGSTDNSRDIIQSYSHRLISVFQANSGQGAAFNAGLAQASGDIICFLDADDYYRPDKLEKVVAAFETHPEWVQISHGRTSIDKDGNIMGRDPTFFNQGNVQPLLLKWGRYAWAITSALCYRRTVLDKVLPIPPRPRAADTYLTATVPFYGQVGMIGEPLMFYRKHGKNRRGQTDNIAYILEQRKDTADCINQTALTLSQTEKFDISRDADFRSISTLQTGRGSLQEALTILWLTLNEARDLGQPTKDTLERILRRCICALSPEDGIAILRFGPKRYIRFKLTGKQPENFELSHQPLVKS
ncbi:MAG: glycosyltransferase [Cyanobacteria bacterium J06554_1]